MASNAAPENETDSLKAELKCVSQKQGGSIGNNNERSQDTVISRFYTLPRAGCCTPIAHQLDASHATYMEYNACQKMYFDRDVVRSLVDMGIKKARAKWASHFLHDDSFAADRHALFFTHVPGMANYIFDKRTGYIS